MKIKEKSIDNFLILIALLAPLLLVVLSKWQESLNVWYVPLHQDTTLYFGKTLEQDILRLPETKGNSGAVLFFIADETCPCTRATLNILKQSMQTSQRQDTQLVILDINDVKAKSAEWAQILKQIPAVPTLLVMEAQHLVYAGPVTAGNMCTTSVLKILGLSILESEKQRTVINWLEEGCYCPIKKTNF